MDGVNSFTSSMIELKTKQNKTKQNKNNKKKKTKNKNKKTKQKIKPLVFKVAILIL